ncbi:SdiA-regulated domain-containing protein [Adhaeribacter swui]|uniref:SdiA-regulated domain-containing protein n=1 Tax=Adhaeribacter swui TaxID=2086471 RepID=A0A7G7GE06_9BACT|nr:SdiA-regulated domain-containing protein [Adhaeribacter swui]QNF35390.1 SdiA-regulated domain-containing protein [Adhaeribacter swui]
MKIANYYKQLKTWGWSMLIALSVLACDATQAESQQKNNTQTDKPKKEKKKKASEKEAASAEVKILKKYELPAILREVSGIAYLGNNQFACVQDESGIIFVYNTQTNRIDKQITFGAAGDYEGIAVVGNTAYVGRSDGKIYEVAITGNQPAKVQQYVTSLTAENNVEGLTYDARGNRLLLIIKGEEAGEKDYKGIYAFDLKAKKFNPEPIAKISLTDPQLAAYEGKKLNKAIQPSEIAVHPVTGAIYVTEASNPQLFILKPDGAIQTRYKLSKQDFNQPEGITFSPTGELYISNEGKKASGNILQVKIQ